MYKQLLRIVQTGPVAYAVQQRRRYWLWGWHIEWYPYGGNKTFESIEAAEAYVHQQRELQQYPKVVKELDV